jgi:hypothetical protein
MTLSLLQSLHEALKKLGQDNGVRLTTQDEIKILSANIGDASDKITATLDDWSFVTILEPGLSRIHLVGDLVGTTKVRTTSQVLQIDLNSGFVITFSKSIYQLGTPNPGEPKVEQIFALAQTIGNWRNSQGRTGSDYYH